LPKKLFLLLTKFLFCRFSLAKTLFYTICINILTVILCSWSIYILGVSLYFRKGIGGGKIWRKDALSSKYSAT